MQLSRFVTATKTCPSDNLSRSGIFAPEQADRKWLWARLTLAPKAVKSCSKAQKTRHVF